MADLERRRCPVCALGDQQALCVRPDGLTVRRCRCGTHFVDPSPTEEELQRFYSGYSETHARWDTSLKVRAEVARRQVPSDHRTQTLVRLLGEPGGADVLDVGFGRGHDLVKFSKLGSHVRGIDLDPTSVDFARQMLDLDAEEALLGDEPPDSVDLVLLHDIVEHPLDPTGLLRDAARVVRPGGLISVWTPNGTFIAREEEPVCLRVDLEHMQYLSAGSMALLADGLGLEVLHIESLGRPDLSGFGSDQGPVRSSALKRLLLRVLPASVLGLISRYRE